MTRTTQTFSTLLPPPVATILLYAADGLAVRLRRFSPSGRPRTPERIEWVPMFRELANSADGIEALKSLAVVGMQAWDCSALLLYCLDSAFRDLGFRRSAIMVLEDLADTARERFSPAARPVYPPPPEVRPRTDGGKPRPPSPSRPRPRPRHGPGFGPG